MKPCHRCGLDPLEASSDCLECAFLRLNWYTQHGRTLDAQGLRAAAVDVRALAGAFKRLGRPGAAIVANILAGLLETRADKHGSASTSTTKDRGPR